MRKYWLLSVICLPLCILMVGLCLLEEGGFSVARVSSPLPHDPRWEVETLTREERGEIENACSQPFAFLKMGSQAYAFVSSDGQYVLKLFKMKTLLPKRWVSYLPESYFKDYRYRKGELRKQHLELTFGGLKAAYETFRIPAGLVCVHLNKTPLLTKRVTVIDRTGTEHQIDLNQTPFVLQRRAELLRPRLHRQMQAGHQEEAMETIRLFFTLVAERLQLGLRDLDSGIKCNYGFVGNQPIQIDCGRLVFDDAVRQKEGFDEEMRRIIDRLCIWANRDYPFLTPLIQEEGEKVMRKYG
jgi:hypothetical protein